MIQARNAKRFLEKAVKQPGYALGVFKNRLRAYIAYLSGSGRSALPEAVTLFLTHSCNLECRMCGQWGAQGVTRKSVSAGARAELAQKDIISIIDGLSSFKPNITLFGGEPFLHPNCIDAVKHIKDRCMHCLIITNGSLIESMAEDIVKSGLDELNVSLDGGPELHDMIRGTAGLFDRVMRGLNAVNKVKAGSGLKKPYINLQCTITRYNYERLEELIDAGVAARAASLTFHNLIFTDRKTLDMQKGLDRGLGCSSGGWEGFVFEPGIDAGILYDRARKILSRMYDFSVDFYPNLAAAGLREYYGDLSRIPSGYRARCLSPWMAAYIFPDGRVGPCLNSDYSYGNIRRAAFEELWNNDKAVKFRKALKNSGIFPACGRCTELYRY